MCKKILVPLDGSTLAEAALPHAMALAKSENAEVVILRVPIVPAREFFGHNDAMRAAINKKIDDESDQYVREKVRRLKMGIVKVIGVVREGPVPETITKVADEVGADLIAMSTHGCTGIRRWLKGSVAEEVVHLTHIPVMLIHPN
ncbi:MAG: universal stress protein [Chloroflexota bacterium]